MDLILACTSHPSSCGRGGRRVGRLSSSQRGRLHGTLQKMRFFKLRIRPRAGPSHRGTGRGLSRGGLSFCMTEADTYGAKLWLMLDIRWRTLADLPVQQRWRPRLAAAGRRDAGRARDRGNLTKRSHFPEVGQGTRGDPLNPIQLREDLRNVKLSVFQGFGAGRLHTERKRH